MQTKVFLVLCSGADDCPGNENGISLDLDSHLSVEELERLAAMTADMARLYPSPERETLAKKIQALCIDAWNSIQYVS